MPGGRKPLVRVPQERKALNTFEVAERYNVSADWVRDVLPYEPGIMAFKHGGSWRFLTDSVDYYFMRRAEEALA